MLDSLDNWVKEFNTISKNSDSIIILSKFLENMTTNKLELGVLSISAFTFNQESFKAQLSLMKTYNNKFEPNNILANAWETAILSSSFIVPPGTFIKPAPTPATTFSAPPLVVPDQSLKIAKQNLESDLNNLKMQNSSYEFIKCFYNAFLSLSYTITGINSIIPIPVSLLINSNTI